MNIILNEKEYVEEVLLKRIIDENKPSNTIVLLAKHYNILKYSKEDIIYNIDTFMNNNCEKYNTVKWYDLIENIVNSAIVNNKDYFILNEVKITESEWGYITTLPKEKNQKLVFTYLIYAKILNARNEKNNNWVSDKYRNEIFKEANVSDKGLEQMGVLHNLLEKQVIYVPNDYTNNSVGMGNIINNEDKVKFIITDFNDYGLQYLLLIGNKKIGQCENCGKYFKKKTVNSNQKRCVTCAKKYKLQQTNESKKGKKNEMEENVTTKY